MLNHHNFKLLMNRGTGLVAPGTVSLFHDPYDMGTLFQSGTRGAPGAAVTADGDPVGLWLDKSGNNIDFTSSGANRPLFRNNTGKNRIHFDGVANYMSAGDNLDLLTGSFLLSIGVKFDNTNNCGVISKSLAGPAASRWSLFKDTNVLYSLLETTSTGAAHKTVADTNTTDNRTLSMKIDRTNGANRLRINGVTQGADTVFAAEATNWNTAYTLFLGVYPDTTGTAPLAGYYFGGSIFGITAKLTPAAPADADLLQMEAAITSRL